jgi:hypothetical protein
VLLLREPDEMDGGSPMNDDIVKQAAALIPGGSSLSQDDREAAARSILALYPSRDIAVSVVDMVHGYTCEFSSDPAYHASQYDLAETVIADALGLGTMERLTIETGRKSGTTHADVWPDGEGWEIDTDRGRVNTPDAGWDRFDHHEELYFRRKRNETET